MNSQNELIEEYSAKKYPFVISPYEDEGETIFFAYLPDIPAVTAVEDSLDGVTELLEDARIEWIHYAVNNNIDIPEPSQIKDLEDYSGRVTLRMPKSLHKTITDNALKEGVSLNSYICHIMQKGINDTANKEISEKMAGLTDKVENAIAAFSSSVKAEIYVNLELPSVVPRNDQYVRPWPQVDSKFSRSTIF
ncbi:MAG: toxin-antitoxin system HicB family antitoxin [Oscillospiraceae bacterium]|jgi:predicted HicB family RNase H-like nuclease|nr:toxin-antitoxin system HicB family antitoxin [Oscillospiraceae bacterium]